MESLGKRSLYILSGSYTKGGSFGLSTFGESPEQDQFRKDMELVWSIATLNKGPYGLPYKQNGKQGIFEFVSLGKNPTPLLNGGTRQQINFAYKDYEEQSIEVLTKIGQLNEAKSPTGNKLAKKLFRKQIIGEEHFSYVVAGENKNGIMDDFYTNLAGHSLVNYPVINTEKIFGDYTFELVSPFSKEEANTFAQFTKPNYVDYSCDYVFSEVEYESVIQRSTVPETLLPNFYSFLTKEFAEDPATIPLDPAELDPESVIPLLKQTPKEDMENKKNKPFFSTYAKNLDLVTPEQKLTFQKAQENIVITAKNFSFAKDYNDKAVMFPMHSRIEWSTPSVGPLGLAIRDAKLDQQLIKWLINNLAGGQAPVPNRPALFSPTPYIVDRTVVDAQTAQMAKTTSKIIAPDINAQSALENFSKDVSAWYTQEFIDQYATMIGNVEDADIKPNNPISFSQVLMYLITKGKLQKILKEKSRSYQEIIEGKPAHSETIFYRVAKHRIDSNGNPTVSPIQNYWVTNPVDAQKIVLYDTQVKYDKSYRYLIFAYVMVIGSEYQYKNLDLQGVEDNLWQTSCDVETKPNLKLIQVPYYGFANTEDSDLFIYDDPPPAPDAAFYPIRGNDTRIKIFLNGNVDRYEMYPIFLLPDDEQKYDKVRRYQKKTVEEKIKFETDDMAASFEIFRIDPDPLTGVVTPPESYKDFETHLHMIVNDANPKATGFAMDRLVPNKKYYYCFRTIDSKGNVSNPSAVFEVEIQSQPGISLGFPTIKIYEMSEKEPKVATRPFRRYLYLKATTPQVTIPTTDDGPSTAIGTKIGDLGVANEKIFALENSQGNPNEAKKFKIRLTSRQTGRKIDVNVRFVYKQTE